MFVAAAIVTIVAPQRDVVEWSKEEYRAGSAKFRIIPLLLTSK